MSKYITLSEAKLKISDYLLDLMGFEAELYINRANNCQNLGELQNVINSLTSVLSANDNKKLINFWYPLLAALKAGN